MDQSQKLKEGKINYTVIGKREYINKAELIKQEKNFRKKET